MVTVPTIPTRDDLGALVIGPELLLEGDPSGPLAGMVGVVKDLFDIAGLRTGAGNPDFLADARPAQVTAAAVRRFVAAGVTVIGKSITDELAYSLFGTNVHYGTPLNTAAPGRIPGGSSAGSASAVAGGLADVALGTDTGGSVRVPSSWCGLFGMRPTHGRIPVDGLVPLAPSSDTVGWFSRSGAVLRTLGRALLADAAPAVPVSRVLVADDLLGLTDPGVGDALRARADLVAREVTGRPAEAVRVLPAGVDLARWLRGFRVRQQWECWQVHGAWVERRAPSFGPDIAARFADASLVTSADVIEADVIRDEVRAWMVELLDDDAVLALPVTMGPAPSPFTRPDKDRMRARLLAVNSIAGSTGSPTVVIPGARVAAGLPVGLGVLGRPGSDTALLDLAATVDAAPLPSGA